MKFRNLSTLRPLALAAATLLLLAAMPGRARAVFQFTLTETSAGVAVAGSGTLNLSALTPGGSLTNAPNEIDPNGAILAVGNDMVSIQGYDGIAGPAEFGPGGEHFASGAGNPVVLLGDVPRLYVPSGYVSGAPLTDSILFPGATFASLGFTPGTYTYTWGASANADSLIVTGAVPEPSTWATLLLGGAGMMGWTLRRRATRM